MSRREPRPRAQHWAAVAAERFAPTRFVIDEAMQNNIEWTLDLCNMIRRAQGLPVQTLDEALAARQADIDSGRYAAWVSSELPRRLAELRAHNEETRRQLAALTNSGSVT